MTGTGGLDPRTSTGWPASSLPSYVLPEYLAFLTYLLALAFCVFGGLVHFLFFCFDHCQRGPASPDVGASAQCSQRFLYARGSFPGRRGPAPAGVSGVD